MKIIQSFWSGPSISEYSSKNLRAKGGWRSQQLHMCSWALSCLSIKKHYSNVELYTDELGYELLIEKMKLPYSSVNVCLDELSKYPQSLFSLAKIKTYSLQNEPFLHLDSDVYIWSRFTVEQELAPLVAQNKETNFQHDLSTLNMVKSKFDFIPSPIRKHTTSVKLQSINAGVLGGSDINFFRKYCDSAFEFANKNIAAIGRLPTPHLFNTILEQVLFYCLVIEESKSINYIFDSIDGNYFKHLCSFEHVPYSKKYIHIIGTYKKLPEIETYLVNRLILEYPEIYYHINTIFEKNAQYTKF